MECSVVSQQSPSSSWMNEHDHDENGHYHESVQVVCDEVDDWEKNGEDLPLKTVLPPETAAAKKEDSGPGPGPVSVSEAKEPVSLVTSPLSHKWNYYYHYPNDKNWNLDSYKLVMGPIESLEALIGINESVTDNIIKNCMLFVMRSHITPMWEDPLNRQGGCFSYKVSNKAVTVVWRKLMYLLCGYSLTVDPKHMEWVNGITISPKRGFCIVKIWLCNCTLQDPAVIVNIEQLVRTGCLFKAHSPEY